PVVAETDDGTGVTPVVVAVAVGGEVDVAAFGATGGGEVVADEALPHVFAAAQRLVDVRHDRFRAVTEVFEHAVDAALVVEPHHYKSAAAVAGVGDRRRVAPEGAGTGHRRFVVAGEGEGEEPDLVKVAAVVAGNQVEAADLLLVVDRVRFVM